MSRFFFLKLIFFEKQGNHWNDTPLYLLQIDVPPAFWEIVEQDDILREKILNQERIRLVPVLFSQVKILFFFSMMFNSTNCCFRGLMNNNRRPSCLVRHQFKRYVVLVVICCCFYFLLLVCL